MAFERKPVLKCKTEGTDRRRSRLPDRFAKLLYTKKKRRLIQGI